MAKNKSGERMITCNRQGEQGSCFQSTASLKQKCGDFIQEIYTYSQRKEL
jgi:hypothetical protein